MNFSTKDFENCLFNPVTKDLLKEHPELAKVSKDEKLLRYIIALYDPGSPIVRRNRDLVVRKHHAAAFAGYDPVKDAGYMQTLYSLKDAGLRGAVVKFLTTFSFPREWFMLQANLQTYYEYGERMMEPIVKQDGEKEKDELAAISIKSKLSQDMEVLNDRIEKGYRKIFGDETDKLMDKTPARTSVESMAGTV